MSLTIIAMTGILLGFLCLMVGFFMEGSQDTSVVREKKARSVKRRGIKKAA
jgi:hypothetical protein